jgi:hypothetical protein
MLNTSQQNSESACMTARYTLKDASLSFHFFHATRTRYDYIRYFQNSEYHPPIMVDANNSNKIDSWTVRITFSKSQDYNLVMRLVETDLMLQDPSIRVVACSPTLLHRDIIPSTAVYTTSRTIIADLPLIFAQFGPGLPVMVLKTTKPSSNIIVFFSTDSAQRALKHNFRKSYIQVTKYVRFPSNSKERLHRTEAKHKSIFRAEGTKDKNYGPRNPIGRGGVDSPSGPISTSFSSPLQHPPADVIKRDWDFTLDRQYVFRTASLDRILAPQNLQCLHNPGRGDCAWFSMIDSGNLNSRFPNVRAF